MANTLRPGTDVPRPFEGAPHTILDVLRPAGNTSRRATRPARYFLIHSLLAISTLLLGLASRHAGWHLAPWVGAYAGDVLWALLVFWLVGLLRPGWRSGTVAVAAGVFALAIELSQLCQVPWLVALRHTVLGGLVLGWVFQWRDLACYAVGILVGYGLESGWLRQASK